MPGSTSHRKLRTFGEVFTGRENSIGFLRLLLALAVLVAHSQPLGFGRADVGTGFTGGQTNLGNLSVFGFFVLSGFLITRSGMRLTAGRYLWHRVIRIFPGLWVCLLLTALVVAPLVAARGNGGLAGFWNHPAGPWDYLQANWWTGVRQHGISGLLPDNPHPGAFNGSLWSLAYEFLCYLLVGVLLITGVLARARGMVLALTAGAYLMIVRDFLADDVLKARQFSAPKTGDTVYDLPLLGGISSHWMLYLVFLFLLGAAAELYKDRLPVHDTLGVLSGVLFIGSMKVGGFFLVGLPAYTYLLLWLSVRLPKFLHRVGSKNDYSYGIYIYAFVVQQVLAFVGGERWGFWAYVGLSVVGTLIPAYLSWHLVEKQAMKLKHWTPGRLKPGRAVGGDREEPTQAPYPAPEHSRVG